MQYGYLEIPSPVGALTLVAHTEALCAVLWQAEKPRHVAVDHLIFQPQHPILLQTQQQLEQYFKGQRQQFDLPLAGQGSGFQQQVWQALRHIPFGETRSYKEIAQHIGQVNAVRAVGTAIGKNPLSIVVPCHRVIGAQGQLTGFAGGLANKVRLLQLEGSLDSVRDWQDHV